ncbi:hypothetical protein B6D60_10975 [candidate division KSB1 bacterium 4484_87]|nr:MAG: hypothetical protein B6D60_10975 [candidate division KSB1 bacterium 4484_87]
MKKYFSVFLLLSIFFVWGCSGSDNESIAQDKNQKVKSLKVEKPKVEKKSDAKPEVVWMKFDEGIAKGLKEKKNMIIDFYTDWCHWCKVMDEKTFHNPKIEKKLAENFVTIRLNAESNTEMAHFQGQQFTNAQLTRAFRVTGFPSLGFLTPKAEVITVIPGYIPADQFGYLLDYIYQECYKKNISLQDFIDKKGDCGQSKSKKM